MSRNRKRKIFFLNIGKRRNNIQTEPTPSNIVLGMYCVINIES